MTLQRMISAATMVATNILQRGCRYVTRKHDKIRLYRGYTTIIEDVVVSSSQHKSSQVMFLTWHDGQGSMLSHHTPLQGRIDQILVPVLFVCGGGGVSGSEGRAIGWNTPKINSYSFFRCPFYLTESSLYTHQELGTSIGLKIFLNSSQSRNTQHTAHST